MPHILKCLKMCLKKKVCVLVFLMGFAQVSFGQTASQLKSLGDDAFKTANYHSAVLFYESSLAMDSSDVETIFNLAESYRHLFNYTAAFDTYSKVWKQSKEQFPLSGFWSAMMLKSIEQYEQAKLAFNQFALFSEMNETMQRWKKRAYFEISACDSAILFLNNPKQIEIENFREVNTPWSEFNPVSVGDTMFIFSALRPLLETENPLLASGDYLSQIYVAEYGFAGLLQPKPMHDNVNGKDMHTANFTVSDDGKRAYFNRCKYQNHKLKCDIWLSESRNNNWTRAKKMPPPLNTEEFTTTQPFVTTDAVSGHDIIYFASDRPGGMGGFDLWFCIIKDGEPQAPINLGSIVNTEGDEITPFYHAPTSTLYFSSDRHYGMGGFDVFQSKGSMSSWEKPKNLGSPINSGSNDFYFFRGPSEESFLTSNRPGSMTYREQTCCNDIYIIKKFKEDTLTIVELFDTIKSDIQMDILELLPLSLYFDNDHPNPRSNSPQTKLNFEETFHDYMKQQERFVNEYSKGLTGLEKYYAITEMEDFFENYVKAGFAKLEILSDFLYQDLKTGSQVVIKVRGFASPLTSAQYNIVLSKRRIASLVNYFKEWNDGVLLQYMTETDTGEPLLQIIEEPSGEALANPFVSDNPHDRQKSVYSKVASLERRIEILIYESDFKKHINVDENIPLIFIEDNFVRINEFVGQSEVEIQIPIHNVGKTQLDIYEINTSSANISIKKNPRAIKPGSRELITVVFHGNITKSTNEHIIIRSNSVEETNVIHFSTLIQ
jgi:hypothetical protein